MSGNSPKEITLHQSDPYDGSGSMYPIYDAIIANRNNYGHVMWLFGDSIFRGAALEKFPDKFTRVEIEGEPLWPFRSPASMLNLVLRDHGLLSEDKFNVVREAKYVACYAGLVGQPDRVAKAVRRLNSLHSSGAIRAGDALIFLNAGLHTQDPDLYEAQWLTLRKAAAQTAGTHVIICDTFDNLSARLGQTIGPAKAPVENFMYDVEWKCPSGRSLSHNEATRNAALAPLATAAETSFLRLSTVIGGWHAALFSATHVPAYANDGIHLNIWGQMRLAGVLFRSVWPDLAISSLESTEALVKSHWQRLGYGARPSQWTAAAALDRARQCYGMQ